MECSADFGDEVRAVGELSVESIGKRRFLGIALSRDVKAVPPDAAGSAADQTRTKHCRGRPFGLEGELKSDSRRKFRLNVY